MSWLSSLPGLGKLERTEDLCWSIVGRDVPLTALDVGAGFRNRFKRFRGPDLQMVALDISEKALELARERELYDHYLQGDLRALTAADLRSKTGVDHFDMVLALDVIEHLPKADGWSLLQRLEELATKYVVIYTPTGFQPQGPEYGDPAQRHLSGWFPHDFEGLGYETFGSGGMRVLHGYQGQLVHKARVVTLIDRVLFRLLGARRRAWLAFGTLAIKDVRGVSPRMSSYEEGNDVS